MVSRNERMEKKRRCFGIELLIQLNFLWMLLMFMSMVHITAAPSCRGHICLNWKIQNTRLVLICKVDALDFAITFYDPFDQETGFCVPYEPCIPLLHKAKITKNHTLHEIIVSIPLQMQLNGWWTCTYGDNNARAVTEVTLQNVPLQTINGIPANKECWTLMMLWCMLGFTCSFLPLRLFILFLTCDPQQVKEECMSCLYTAPQKGKDECEPCLGTDQRQKKKRLTKNCSKKLIVTILSVTLFGVPVIVGLADQGECKAFKEFAIYGAIVGVIICVLLNTDKNTNPTADMSDQDKNTNPTADMSDQDKNTNDTADMRDPDETNTNDTADMRDPDKTNTNDTADMRDPGNPVNYKVKY
ncbi:uncharacterized protein [Mytilus edulis]|uniref:uncharacterized protein n=1 Tax=Mytilus edulis TaxID=6550 RepID=UPI0039F0EE6A